MRAVPIFHTQVIFRPKKPHCHPSPNNLLSELYFFFFIISSWCTCPFIRRQVFPRMAQSVHGGMITVVARRADRLRQAATLLQQLQFDAGTLHGCQHAITDCPSPPSWLHLDAVKVTFSFGALVRHQAGALGLCLWEWTWNFSFNVRTKIIFYSLTFQSPTGKSSVGGLWYLIYKKPMVCTLHGRVLETETKVALNTSSGPHRSRNEVCIFIHCLSLTFHLNKKILSWLSVPHSLAHNVAVKWSLKVHIASGPISLKLSLWMLSYLLLAGGKAQSCKLYQCSFLI